MTWIEPFALSVVAMALAFAALHVATALRVEVAILKERVGKLHHALEIQLDFNLGVDKHLDRIDARSSQPSSAERDK